jgi:hypothetical protein
MLVEPNGSAAVEMLALVSLTATVPNVVPPPANVTVPKGSRPVEDVAVAVKVTI